MTPAELHRLRQTQHWRNAHALTVTGYYAAGVQRMNSPSYGNQRIITGNVVENPQGERMEVMGHGEWWLNGVAINHDFGDLNMETVNR